MENILQHDTEGDIEYKLINKGDDIDIIVKNNKTNSTITKNYECIYRPIFGYDVSDINNINELLDNMINQMKE